MVHSPVPSWCSPAVLPSGSSGALLNLLPFVEGFAQQQLQRTAGGRQNDAMAVQLLAVAALQLHITWGPWLGVDHEDGTGRCG